MDFNILHLSDLHINDSDSLQTNLEKLLEDISEQVLNIHKIIIVVTGDIVDKGLYNENSIRNVIDFFTKLRDIIKEKFESILIVPGNHDRVQCKTSNMIIQKIREDNVVSSISAIDWEYHLLSYRSFLALEDEIYKIFYPDSIQPIQHDSTFGVEKYVDQESVIIFIKLDTAWCSLGGEKDKRNLRIFIEQLQELKKEYQKLKNEVKGKRILTIGVCHHPLKWLTEADEELLYSYFINEEYLNVDILLCGHVHDIEFNNTNNNFHQITTLVTGIGWKESTPKEKRNKHRYSIYVINLRRNSCEAIVRKTDAKGDFDIDRDFLPDKISKNAGKLSIPIIAKNNHPYIEIPVYTNEGLRNIPLFIDKNILTNIKVYSNKLSEILSHIKETLFLNKEKAINDFTYTKKKNQKEMLKNFFDNGEYSVDVKKILEDSENHKWVCLNFNMYLCEICSSFINTFNDCFSTDEDIRIFFRFYDIKNKEKNIYKQICQWSKSTGMNNEINNARDIDYNSLIEKAHKLKTALVFSSNTWYNNLELNKWNNFITIVPIYDKYEHIKNKKKYPLLTCGISIKVNSQQPFLDILNYIEIQDIFKDMIVSYLNAFHINITDIVNFYFEDTGGNSNT